MTVEVKDNSEAQRYEVYSDGELAGFTRYQHSRGRIAFSHTEIDQRFEGRGLGSRLVRAALDDARAKGLAVEPFCPFVRNYIQRHSEYSDLVPERFRS